MKYIPLIAMSIPAKEIFIDKSSLAERKMPIAIKNKSSVHDI